MIMQRKDIVVIVELCGIHHEVELSADSTINDLRNKFKEKIGSLNDEFYLSANGLDDDHVVLYDGLILETTFCICGGVDFQHREGSKTGGGGLLSESQAAIDRKERLRKLALETIDITKDPYFMKNHLGTFECKLCLTLHPNEGNYLAHTQGKRHQSNLGRRAAMEAKSSSAKVAPTESAPKKKVMTIGRPGYKVIAVHECFNYEYYVYNLYIMTR